MKKVLIKGFTLVELMVVVAIIAVLTAIVSANLTSARAKSRDAKRISDVGNIQLAVTIFFERCNKYPALIDTAQSCLTSSGATVTLGDFISVIPKPPTPIGADKDAGNNPAYRYGVDDQSTPTDYLIGTQLENTNSSLNDDIDTSAYSVTCTDTGSGNESNNYCIGPQ